MLGFPQGFCAGLVGKQLPVEIQHQILGLTVRNLPKAHHQSLGPSERKSPPQPKDALPDPHRSKASITRRQHDKVGRQEVETQHIDCVDNSVFRAALEPGVCPCEGKA